MNKMPPLKKGKLGASVSYGAGYHPITVDGWRNREYGIYKDGNVYFIISLRSGLALATASRKKDGIALLGALFDEIPEAYREIAAATLEDQGELAQKTWFSDFSQLTRRFK